MKGSAPRVLQAYFPGGRLPETVRGWQARWPAGQRSAIPAHGTSSGHAFPTPPGFLTRRGQGGGQPLPATVKSQMESFFQTDFSQVRVHVGPEASAIGALAFTVGTDLYFAPGQYQPNTPSGKQLLGHELTHVLQQQQGRVANPYGDGLAVVHDSALEEEAEQLGQLAALQPGCSRPGSNPVQRRPARVPLSGIMASESQTGGARGPSKEKPRPVFRVNFAPGHIQPTTAAGGHLLARHLSWVAPQGPGRVSTTLGRGVATPGLVQRRTTFADQTAIRRTATSIVIKTTDQEITALQNRITFNANFLRFTARVALFAGYRNHASDILNNYGNNLVHAAQYMGDGLDNELATLTNHLAEIDAVRNANDKRMVDARKFEMFSAIANPVLSDRAYSHNGNAFRNAVNFAVAQAALTAWETNYFTLTRAQIIEFAKLGAINGGGGGSATIWKGLSPKIKWYDTHMTIHNENIPNFANYLVTAATDRAASDQLANLVLANGAGQSGIHLTAECHEPPTPNPRVFGNPPDPARNSNVPWPEGGTSWVDFSQPLRTAQNAVRDNVWARVLAIRNLR